MTDTPKEATVAEAIEAIDRARETLAESESNYLRERIVLAVIQGGGILSGGKFTYPTMLAPSEVAETYIQELIDLIQRKDPSHE